MGSNIGGWSKPGGTVAQSPNTTTCWALSMKKTLSGRISRCGIFKAWMFFRPSTRGPMMLRGKSDSVNLKVPALMASSTRPPNGRS